MKSIHEAATDLQTTLEKTEREIINLHEGLSRQLDAVRHRQSIALQESTDDVNDISNKLKLLLNAKMQQAELLSAALKIEDARTDLGSIVESLHSESRVGAEIEIVLTRIRTLVERTSRLYEDLAFALHYSATLDEELLMAVIDQSVGDESITYSPTGSQARPERGGKLLNRFA